MNSIDTKDRYIVLYKKTGQSEERRLGPTTLDSALANWIIMRASRGVERAEFGFIPEFG